LSEKDQARATQLHQIIITVMRLMCDAAGRPPNGLGGLEMLAHPVLHGIARGEPSSALMEHAHDVIDDHALLFHMVRLLTQGGWQVDEKKASDRHGVGDRVRASERQPLHAKSHRDYKGIAPEIVASWSEEEVAAHEKLVAARCWRILAERHRPTYEHSKRLYHIFRSWNVWVNSSLLLKETKRKYTFPHLDATANVWAAAHGVGDFVRTDGKWGSMGKFHYVYGRKGLLCKLCGTLIKSTKLGGRTSSFCPHCQR
jgi:hypothetical protein